MVILESSRINNLTNCVGILLSPCDSVANRLPIARRLGANLQSDNKPYGDNEIETIHGTLTATASREFSYLRLRLWNQTARSGVDCMDAGLDSVMFVSDVSEEFRET